MKIALRRFLVSAQIGTLVAIAPAASFAEENNFFVKAFDLTFLRPLGSVKLVVGLTALIPTAILYSFRAPFDPESGLLSEAAEILVVEPANFVFRRPLGEDLQGD